MSDIISGLDSSSVCDSNAAACLKKQGFSFVMRYYRSRKSKLNRLTQEEAKTICGAGLTLGAVFEFRSTSAPYFTTDQASQDAEDAFKQAAAVGQPLRSAIYFTVDYDADPKKDLKAIRAYFQVVANAIRPTYKIGVYGSGAICGALLDAGLADFAWLSQSTGFAGTATFTRWNLKQAMPLKLCGLDSDPDTAHDDFGGFVIK
jgi:hypothetical protein